MHRTSQAVIRVLLIDDHPMVLDGLRAMLAPLTDIVVVGSATTAATALAMVHTTHPHVVLLDLVLPDGDGLDICRQLLRQHPALRVVALTVLKDRHYLLRLREAGAVGYILKNILPEELAAAIRKVHGGKMFFSDEMQELLTEAEPSSSVPLLTRREKQVLSLVAEGLTSYEIANKLVINHLTVETHRRNLLAKFAVTNTAAMIKLASEQGFI